jgi:carbon-monoxide dehydrogenase iron sulfur subunit
MIEGSSSAVNDNAAKLRGARGIKGSGMLKLKRSLCTECQICMAICSFNHFGQNTTKRSRIHVESDWPKVPAISVCLACQDHECVAACPHEALSWQDWVRLDKDRCDGCAVCVDACPVNGIRMDSQTDLPLICDTCEGKFQCVQWCPTGAVQKRNIRS